MKGSTAVNGSRHSAGPPAAATDPHAETGRWRSRARRFLARRLARTEQHLLGASDSLACRPVFIVGPPRTGTTLLYELMVTRFRFAYLSRAAQAVWTAPAAMTQLARPLIRRWSGDYTSRYGQLRGWGAPHEAVRIWARWMPGEGALGPLDIDADAADTCRRTVAAIAQVLDAPFLAKNPTHSVRIRLLAELFPLATFLEVRRDDVATVRSILAMRRDWNGPDRVHEWMAVRPRGWDADPAHAHDALAQACTQVLGTRRDIAEDIAAAAPGRHLVVRYGALCAETGSTLGAVAAFLERHGTVLDARGAVPDRFQPSGPRLTAEDDRLSDAEIVLALDAARNATSAAPVQIRPAALPLPQLAATFRRAA